MKLIITLLAALGVSTSASALERYSVKCENSKNERFSFRLTPETRSIVFQDISYFGHAQILASEPFGVDFHSPYQHFSFTYDWYYTAEYEFRFASPLYSSQTNQLSLTWDDSDGIPPEPNQLFSCKVNKID